MRKNLRFTIIILSVFLLSSCAKKPAELVVGKWKVADLKTTSEISNEQQEAFQNEMKKLIANSFLELKADNNFEKKYGGDNSSGIWSISEDGKKLTLMYGKNKEVSTVNKLTEDTLSISITVNDEVNTIVFAREK